MTNYVSGGKMWSPKPNPQVVFPPNKHEIVTRASSWTLIAMGAAFFVGFLYLSISRHFAWEYKEINKSPELLSILVNQTSNNILIIFAVASIICSVIGVFKLLSLSNVQQNRKVNPLRHGWQNSILLFIVVMLGLAALGTILSTNDSASTIHNKSVASFESWMKSKGLDVTHDQAVEVIDDAWGQKNSNMFAVKAFKKPLVIDGKTHTVEIAKQGDNSLFFSVDTKKNAVGNDEATKRANW
jgi:hypothetical protein